MDKKSFRVQTKIKEKTPRSNKVEKSRGGWRTEKSSALKKKGEEEPRKKKKEKIGLEWGSQRALKNMKTKDEIQYGRDTMEKN